MVRKEMSERITVRLPKKMVSEIDNLVMIEEYTNRSDVIRDAVKFFLSAQMKEVVEKLHAKEEFHTYVSKAIKETEEEERYLRE
jgi:Arc/MetJ-type ribon-helix-helix transcriptional regulator